MQIDILSYKDIAIFSKTAKRIIKTCNYYSRYARQEELKNFAVNILRKRLKDGSCVYLVAKEADDIAGFCFGYLDAGTFWIDWIGIKEHYRQRGLALQLLLDIEKIAKKSKAHKIWCDTRITNKPSISLLKRAHFKKMGGFKKHWYGQDFYFWEKFI